MVVFVDFVRITKRRAKYLMILLLEAKREKKETRERRAEERLCITPKKRYRRRANSVDDGSDGIRVKKG